MKDKQETGAKLQRFAETFQALRNIQKGLLIGDIWILFLLKKRNVELPDNRFTVAELHEGCSLFYPRAQYNAFQRRLTVLKTKSLLSVKSIGKRHKEVQILTGGMRVVREIERIMSAHGA